MPTTKAAMGYNFLSDTFFPVTPSINAKTTLPPSNGINGNALKTARNILTKASKLKRFI